MITNALRVMPISVKGFSFLAALGRHMTSYSNDVPDEVEKQDQYPKLMINNTIIPQNSSFDKQQKKYKRKISMKNAGNRGTSENRTDGNVRKYHKKFWNTCSNLMWIRSGWNNQTFPSPPSCHSLGSWWRPVRTSPSSYGPSRYREELSQHLP